MQKTLLFLWIDIDVPIFKDLHAGNYLKMLCDMNVNEIKLGLKTYIF